MTTDRSANHIEKQVEEAIACDCHMQDIVASPELYHLKTCPAAYRPAVLALLERREQEHAAEVKKARLDEADGIRKVIALNMVPAAYAWLTERIAALRAEQPELGPCPRHDAMPHIDRVRELALMLAQKLVDKNIVTEAHVYTVLDAATDMFRELDPRTACAQEKAAPGGVSNVES